MIFRIMDNGRRKLKFCISTNQIKCFNENYVLAYKVHFKKLEYYFTEINLPADDDDLIYRDPPANLADCMYIVTNKRYHPGPNIDP